MLELNAISKTYFGAGRRILSDVSFALGAGVCCAIMGESGVGKSTLLNIIAGLEVPDSGEVKIADQPMTSLTENERTLLRRAKIGFVFQAFHLLPHLTITDNIVLPLALNGVDDSGAQQRAHTLLASVGLRSRANDLPSQLSGGEQQRVAVARALAHHPALILADEPTGNLDAENAEQLLLLLRDEVKRSNAALLLVTHSPIAARMMDRVMTLDAHGLHGLMSPAS